MLVERNIEALDTQIRHLSIGDWIDEHCVECGTQMLSNRCGDLWCSAIGCEGKIARERDRPPHPLFKFDEIIYSVEGMVVTTNIAELLSSCDCYVRTATHHANEITNEIRDKFMYRHKDNLVLAQVRSLIQQRLNQLIDNGTIKRRITSEATERS